MRYTMILLGVIIFCGCGEKKPEKKKRYYYVAYEINENPKRQVGNFTMVSDTFPSKEYYKDILFEKYKCDGWAKWEIVILSISEFKDSLEYLKWVNPDGEKMDTCTPYIQGIKIYGNNTTSISIGYAKIHTTSKLIIQPQPTGVEIADTNYSKMVDGWYVSKNGTAKMRIGFDTSSLYRFATKLPTAVGIGDTLIIKKIDTTQKLKP